MTVDWKKLDMGNVALAAIGLILLVYLGNSLFGHTQTMAVPPAEAVAEEAPIVAPPVLEHANSSMSQIVLKEGETITPPPRRPEEAGQNAEAIALQQLDYETFKKMQAQAIDALRKRIREKGVGGDGITEEDLDRMLKNDQFPQ